MLGHASVHDSIVLVVSVDDRALKPLVVSVADEALAVWKLLGAVHLTVATEVGSEGLLLTDGVLHERTTVVHGAVNGLSTHPLVSSEWGLINVHDLEPLSHEVLLFEFLLKRLHVIADNVLLSNLAIVD